MNTENFLILFGLGGLTLIIALLVFQNYVLESVVSDTRRELIDRGVMCYDQQTGKLVWRGDKFEPVTTTKEEDK